MTTTWLLSPFNHHDLIRNIAFLLLVVLTPTTRSLWPIPRSLQTGSKALKLSPDFAININFHGAPQDLSDAVSRTKSFLVNDKLQRLVVDRGASGYVNIQRAKGLSSLELYLADGATVQTIAEESVKEITTRSEAYTLSIPADGSSALLAANSTLGLFRGLTTFEQLWYYFGGEIYTLEAPVYINDAPAYPYRGFMLDTARNFFPVADIKRTLDAMSWVKINMFHWHVVDSQSFPLEVAEFPELSHKGAYSADEIYTPSDLQEIVAYAGARGIDVLLEVDIPGHTAAISASHPEHIACSQASPWGEFAAQPPAGQLRLASSATTNFTANLLSAIANVLPSKLFSTGGDELNTNCYTQDLQTQADLSVSGRTLEQALDVFTRVSHDALIKAGKTPVVWEEMVLDHNITLYDGTIVMVWISSENAAKVVDRKFRIVHAPSDYFYLDCGGGGWLADDPTGNSWCDPFKTWQKSYTFDPLANMTRAEAELVLGGQQLLWSEQASPENLDSIVWPRAASSAEVFWTGATLPDGNPRDVSSALPRLHDVRYRMVRRGIRAIPLQPHWCALRPGVCSLDAKSKSPQIDRSRFHAWEKFRGAFDVLTFWSW